MVLGEILGEVPHPKIPGQTATEIAVKPIEKTGDELKTAYNNLSLSKMRADLLEVPPFFFTFDWCLRYTTDQNNPVITADTAIRLGGDATSHDGAVAHFTTRLYFPLCWEACLIGAPIPQIPKTKIYSPRAFTNFRINIWAPHVGSPIHQ